jgi:hypothetical protein
LLHSLSIAFPQVEVKMKKPLKMLLINVIIIGLFSPQYTQPAKSSTTIQKSALAYYFYWYRYPDQHFIDVDGSDALTDHPPAQYLTPPPDYSFEDPDWHARELHDLMDAGIEMILPVYWGDYTSIFWSQSGLSALVTAENQLISNADQPPKIGMFYDTTALKIQNGNQPPDLTTSQGKQMFYQMIYDFFSRIPDHSMWARVDGKPVIFLYVSAYVSKYDQGTFDYVTTHFKNDFSNEEPYIVKESSWTGVTTDGEYTWGAAVYGPNFHGNLAAVGPGYDDSAVYGRYPYTYKDRECGEFYQDGWNQVIDSSATLTVLETWNEYHEGTDIANSQEYARQYIDLTAQNIAAWKVMDNSTRTYAWVDLGKFPYISGLQAPNLGDGTWGTTFLAGRRAAYPDHNSKPDASYHIYLNVDDNYILGRDNSATPVWVTVEYYDGGYDSWFLQYDSVGPNEIPYTFRNAETVTLQGTNQWKRITFYLPDAYFANRQQGGLADLRLVDAYDGTTNYFGRVWVFKMDPSSLHAPNLTGLTDIGLSVDYFRDILITPTDPDGGVLTLHLDHAPDFASLIDHHNGSYTVHLAPTQADVTGCTYRLRLIVSDNTTPSLADAETIAVFIYTEKIFLPAVVR